MAMPNINFKIVAVDLTQKTFRAIRKSLSVVTRALFSFRTSLVAVAGAGGLGLLVKSSLDSIDRISKLSRTLGIGVSDLRKLELAADLSGVQLDTLARGVRTLNKGMVDFVRDGSGEAADAFEALGISAEDLNGVIGDQFKVLELIADRFEDVENAAERSSIAQELFGGRASELLLVLEEGSEGLARISKEAQDFGLILSTATARNVEEANDAFTRLSGIFKGLRDTVVGALAPAFQKLADVIRERILEEIVEAGGIEEFGKKLALSIINFTEKAAKSIAAFTTRTINGFRRVKIAIDELFGKDTGDAFEKTLKPFEETSTYREITTIFDDLRRSIETTSPAADILNGKFKDTNGEVSKGKTALEEYADAAKITQDNLQDMAVGGLRRVEDAFANMVTGAGSAKDAFKSMAQSMLADLARLAARQALGRAITGFGLGNMFGGFRAAGGPVQAGKAYVVGEQGPEMFVPNRNGTIVPNGAGGGVTVNQTINLTTGVSQTVRTEVMNMLPQIQQAAISGVLDARRRGGSFGSVFGG